MSDNNVHNYELICIGSGSGGVFSSNGRQSGRDEEDSLGGKTSRRIQLVHERGMHAIENAACLRKCETYL